MGHLHSQGVLLILLNVRDTLLLLKFKVPSTRSIFLVEILWNQLYLASPENMIADR